MQALNRQTAGNIVRNPERILQFGEGNFLRAFVDWMVDKMNKQAGFNAGVVAVQPIERGMAARLNAQDGLYHLVLQGIREGRPVREATLVDCINRALDPYRQFDQYMALAANPELRFIVSNTTEAGIVLDEDDTPDMRPPNSFPGKLTVFLYRRYRLFNGAADKGFIIFCCELIDRNADKLKDHVLAHARRWGLEPEFLDWIGSANTFCNTLVDRIVPGFPGDRIDAVQQELGYRDELVVEGEYFHLWVIEAPAWVEREFPAQQAGLNVIFTDDMSPYRERKVRILNGVHTASFAVSSLYGLETVQQSIEHPVVGRFMREVVSEEICPNILMPRKPLQQFADSVLERFHNPFIKHLWQSIALNAVSKWETRVLPSLHDYHARTHQLPEKIVFSLAALIAYYRGEFAGRPIPVQDSPQVSDAFKKAWSAYDGSRDSVDRLVRAVLCPGQCWTRDLNAVDGLAGRVAERLYAVQTDGIEQALARLW